MWKRSERKLECPLKSYLFVKDKMPQNTPQEPLRKDYCGLLQNRFHSLAQQPNHAAGRSYIIPFALILKGLSFGFRQESGSLSADVWGSVWDGCLSGYKFPPKHRFGHHKNRFLYSTKSINRAFLFLISHKIEEFPYFVSYNPQIFHTFAQSFKMK